MRQMTLELPDKLFERLENSAQAAQRTPVEFLRDLLRRGGGEETVTNVEAKVRAEAFVRERVGRVLTVREPVLDEGGIPVWLAPLATNFRPEETSVIGHVAVDARNGTVQTSESEFDDMFRRAHPRLGFAPLAPDKADRLSELLCQLQDAPLLGGEQDELEALVEEEQALQVANLEQLNRRLLPNG